VKLNSVVKEFEAKSTMDRILYVKLVSDSQSLREYYERKVHAVNYSGDSGVDLPIPKETTFISNTVTTVKLGIQCKLVINGQPAAFMLMPRSSIVKTPLMLANSVGLIDSGYRGELAAAFRCFGGSVVGGIVHSLVRDDCKMAEGARLVQAVAFDGKPMRVVLLGDDEELDTTERGEGGFGSTGQV
jgi:dUTP pyrophosphatase